MHHDCLLDELQPFPSSSPPSTSHMMGAASQRSYHLSMKSHAHRSSRSRSSRIAQSLSRSSTSAPQRPAAQTPASTAAVDLLTKHLAPLPRFNPFARRRRSESLSAIVSKENTRQPGNVKEDLASPAPKVCRRMSTWSCLRTACRAEGWTSAYRVAI